MVKYRVKKVNARRSEAFPFRFKLQRNLFGNLWYTIDWWYGLTSAIKALDRRCEPVIRVSEVVYEGTRE